LNVNLSLIASLLNVVDPAALLLILDALTLRND
jgi:hypothetical protein